MLNLISLAVVAAAVAEVCASCLAAAFVALASSLEWTAAVAGLARKLWPPPQPCSPLSSFHHRRWPAGIAAISIKQRKAYQLQSSHWKIFDLETDSLRH